MNYLKIIFIFFTLVLLNGCLQTSALLGPGVTIISTGNIPQAGFQYAANQSIKNQTGKDALTFVKDTVEEKQNKRKFNKDFKNMVKKRVLNARKKILVN
tara:strand:+ start:1451 stop:1747 length:297 start_codon:yes stop_codon:yes gene_type:complete